MAFLVRDQPVRGEVVDRDRSIEPARAEQRAVVRHRKPEHRAVGVELDRLAAVVAPDLPVGAGVDQEVVRRPGDSQVIRLVPESITRSSLPSGLEHTTWPSLNPAEQIEPASHCTP